MSVFERWQYMCDRLMHCKAALDVCELHEVGTWVRYIDYCKTQIPRLEAWM